MARARIELATPRFSVVCRACGALREVNESPASVVDELALKRADPANRFVGGPGCCLAQPLPTGSPVVATHYEQSLSIACTPCAMK
jgi:hypothetical protein